MTVLPQTTELLTSLDSGWLTITLDRPEARNALSEAMATDLITTLDWARENSVRGITLRANGPAFCAGGDLKAFAAALQGTPDREALVALNKSGAEIFHKVKTAPQTIIALIDGPALAGGMGLAACADIMIVTPNAKFALTETRLGIIPAQIAPHMVDRLGSIKTKRLMLTGAKFDGTGAHEMGLADYIVPDLNAGITLESELRAQVLECAPHANAAVKELINDAAELEREAFTHAAAERFADCLISAEGKEGVTAFMQKRKPDWAPQADEEQDR
ncbi:MAG: enoyl-CoA hydratase/isomerase family protein [Pseudomonadota bacterium]